MQFLKKLNVKKIEIVLFLFSAFLLYKVDFSVDYDADFYFKKEDIYYEYQAAKQIQNGENPYNRILEGNMVENDKYATQFPLYFLVLAQLREFSDNDFSGFLENFRVILYVSQLIGGGFIYAVFKRINKPLLGYFGALFYVFNVWSLNSIIFLKQDMVAIALLLASFYYFRNEKARWVSYVFFGLSLGIKHIGIFAAPMYLTPLLFKEDSPKKFSINIALLVATLLVPSLSFIIDNPQSFLNSMLFSLTRAPSGSELIYGYNELLLTYQSGSDNGTLFQQLLPRLPLLIASFLALALLFLRKIPPSAYLLISIVVFAIFNPVIFPQYITWLPPLLFIAFSDFVDSII